MIGKQYASEVLSLTQRVIEDQFEQISAAADKIYASLKQGGLLHIFGCGHSHIPMEECFYRAGGLVPINPLFETSTMLHEGAVKSSQIERMTGYAPLILDNYNIKAGETLLIFSTSGINSLPIEMALTAKEKGLLTIAITSLNYRDKESRYKTGQKLCDVTDIVIDTQAPCGDAIINFERSGIHAVPSSTILAITIVNTLIAEILERYDQDGLTPPVFCSGNIEGGIDRNKEYIDKYRYKIKSL